MGFNNDVASEHFKNFSDKPTKKSNIINPFHGGIALGAIYAMNDLSSSETAVLIFIGSQTDFRHDGHSSPSISKKEISAATKISRSTVTRVLISLVSKNYLYIENNFDQDGYKIENTYYLADYLFLKYAEMMYANFGRAHHEPTEGSPRACILTSVADSSSDSFFDFDHKEKKINNNECLKSCGSVGEAEALSTHQTGMVQAELRTNSPKANMAQERVEFFDSELDDSFEEKTPIVNSKDQFKSKIQKTKDDHPEYTLPIVTYSHRKMIGIFRITDPEIKKKSFVLDNDIHSFTDQILIKYGPIGHNVIDLLFTDMVELGKCGKITWDLNKAFQRLDIAYKKLLTKMENTDK